MILEIATLDVIPGREDEFERAFGKAQEIISGIPGYLSHELRQCVEQPNRYVLLVNWETLEAHTRTFRESEQYQTWKALLHHFYHPAPTVQHYRRANLNGAR